MTDDSTYHRIMHKALADVGGLFMYWGQLETHITYCIVTMDPTTSGLHINPANAARTLEALMNKWLTVYCTATRAGLPKAKQFDAAVRAASKHRNNLAHGFTGVVLSPKTYTVGCWEGYHRYRMSGSFPPQRFYDEKQMADLLKEAFDFKDTLNELLAVALARPRKPQSQ